MASSLEQFAYYVISLMSCVYSRERYCLGYCRPWALWSRHPYGLPLSLTGGCTEGHRCRRHYNGASTPSYFSSPSAFWKEHNSHMFE